MIIEPRMLKSWFKLILDHPQLLSHRSVFLQNGRSKIIYGAVFLCRRHPFDGDALSPYGVTNSNHMTAEYMHQNLEGKNWFSIIASKTIRRSRCAALKQVHSGYCKPPSQIVKLKLYSIKVVHITSSYRKEVIGPLANDISNFLKYTWFWKHQKFIILGLPRASIAELLQDKELPFSYYGTTDVYHLKSLALQCSRQYKASVDGHIVKLIYFECQWCSRQFLQFLQL